MYMGVYVYVLKLNREGEWLTLCPLQATPVRIHHSEQSRDHSAPNNSQRSLRCVNKSMWNNAELEKHACSAQPLPDEYKNINK